MSIKLIKSGLPFAFYTWIVISTATVALFLFTDIFPLYAIGMSIIISFITFVVMCQYSCKFILDGNSITFKYAFPFNKTISIDLNKASEIRFELSYYYFLDEDFKMGVYYWYRPYDILYVIQEGETDPVIVKFNSSYFKSLEMYSHLRKQFHKPFWLKTEK